MSINKVVLTGRLTKDIELKATPSGANVVSFSIAVDGFGKDQAGNTTDSVSFVNCVAWNKQAQFLASYCKKGNLVALEGRLQVRSYDRKDGTKAYVTEVICERIENLSPRDKSTDGSSVSISDQESDDVLSYSDDDLPF